MAGGDPHQPPPPHEDGEKCPSFKTILFQSTSTHPLSLGSQSQPQISAQNLIPLEEGEIPSIPKDADKLLPPSATRTFASSINTTDFVEASSSLQTNFRQIPNPSASFLEVVKSPSEFKSDQVISEIDFPLKPITLFQGKPSIAFNILEKSKLLADMKFVLVTHGRPPMVAIQKFFVSLKLKGHINLSLLDKKTHFY
ncbi:hypothetical protein LIER_41681 [Lithospermum erythrorhizon]|uniref:Uncharacterized protein n=1 Tax=Lithospermum erythrorhizon TaxID=34254 RepID=A0AAV3RGI1_LITER